VTPHVLACLDDQEGRAPIIRRIEDLDEPLCSTDDVASVAGARVVWADWPALRRDFFAPDTAPEVIERWLLASAAVMSVAQWDSPGLAPPGRPGRTSVSWRPPRYGRAAVVPVQPHRLVQATSARLLDIKGCGMPLGMHPSGRRGDTGLLLLPDALCELLTQLVLERLCATCLHERLRGVPVYAVLSLEFDARVPGRQCSPVACLVRAAHRRRAGNRDLPQRGSSRHRAMLRAELSIRAVGFTSTSDDLAYRVVDEGGALAAFVGEQRLPQWLGDALVSRLRSHVNDHDGRPYE